jgi:serine/threonine-protein kinase
MGASDGGISNDDTVAEEQPQTGARASRRSFGTYEVSARIGEGGMGEVLLARDSKIGRDVAIKRMRAATPSPESVDRFMREAKIQARLDHPAIVPVYDLGHDADGAPYFTMKRLAGTTLLDLLTRGGATLQSVLRALVGVCQAIDFAHTRGVVHRDLKPANIILGDFGEVYVLDWGVARVLTREVVLTPSIGSPSVAPGFGQTQVGAVLGTPGYMAPEQARGEEIGTPADVYALGQILFDILGAETRAGRTPPPELEALADATHAPDPLARPTARELAQSVQSYLDGDRDHDRRAALAAELVTRARAAAGDPLLRANAIRDAGRALALDPESQDASALVMRLMLEPPKQLPDQLLRQLDKSDVVTSVQSAKSASAMLTLSMLLIPLMWLAGIKHVWPVVVCFTLIAAVAVHSLWQARRGVVDHRFPVISGVIIAVFASQALSPFVLVPVALCGIVVGLGTQAQLLRRPWLVGGLALAALAAPFVLEAAGVLAKTWEIKNDQLVITSQVVHLSGSAGMVTLVAGNALVIVVVCAFLRVMTLARRDQRRQVEIQAWQLQQLLPAPPPSAELAALVEADCT